MVTLQRTDYANVEWKNGNKLYIDDNIIAKYLARSLEINI